MQEFQVSNPPVKESPRTVQRKQWIRDLHERGFTLDQIRKKVDGVTDALLHEALGEKATGILLDDPRPPKRKLTPGQIEAIRNEHDKKLTPIRNIACKYGTTVGHIYSVVFGGARQ